MINAILERFICSENQAAALRSPHTDVCLLCQVGSAPPRQKEMGQSGTHQILGWGWHPLAHLLACALGSVWLCGCISGVWRFMGLTVDEHGPKGCCWPLLLLQFELSLQIPLTFWYMLEAQGQFVWLL